MQWEAIGSKESNIVQVEGIGSDDSGRVNVNGKEGKSKKREWGRARISRGGRGSGRVGVVPVRPDEPCCPS